MSAGEPDRAGVPGPIPGTRMTPEVLRQVGRLAYLWAWPMVNLHNRRVAFEQVPTHGLIGGGMPAAPLNNLTMLHDYAPPEQRFVATPNQDVAYGFGILALEREPVVVQVPDFGDRFWVYQLGDQRTDGFANLGQMYGSEPGCYLLVGPDWQGSPPEGIQDVLRSPTNIGFVIPRVFMDDTAADRQAILPLVAQIMAYPLREFTGQLQTKDWTQLPTFPAPQTSGGGEVQWVNPEQFFDVLVQVLDEVPPLAGEQALYGLVSSVLQSARQDPEQQAALKAVAQEADQDLIGPLFQYSNEGVPLEHGWGTLLNAARFGTDYVTRTAAAKANIFANKPEESTYFFTDVDANGERLHGRRDYSVTFPGGQLPPVKGFWSLTLYDQHHFFATNDIGRYSVGTKNQDLHLDQDGSLTISVQQQPPQGEARSNWLPAPDAEFTLFLRAYWPEAPITDGKWAPPPVISGR